ncbi:unnamed protein product [Clonostachys rosea]|uniref:Translation elongation factor IF5A C-terminal domain-containing protein n=1 Tax=Bionectria ochroleuca TaxID=29856 RepID=A0ABY6UW20_BIOOC|nr:unnamed protein product [Clonostachys rosea]
MDHHKEDGQGQNEASPSGGVIPDSIHARRPEAMTDVAREAQSSSVDTVEAHAPNTISIPCHHIRLGDFIMLQGRPCMVIRISTNATTGQYRYLGVDTFTKELFEESSFVSNPAPGVIIQTMLGPVFQQYRALEIKDGQVVAMTETGDVKEGLPIIDQAAVYDRLSQAIESGGSVRVLVLVDGDRELVVDMKVIHGSKLASDERDKAFQAAVRANDILKVKDALAGEPRPNIDVVDENGRTVLFGAVENRFEKMVDLLLEHEIDIEVKDKEGQTVLDISVSDPEQYHVTLKLLQKGALPMDLVDNDITNLFSAVAEGQIGELRHMLGENVLPSSRDRLGYTALHEAVCFGHYEVAKTLIENGADINAKITHGGATVLHSAIQRGREHRRFFTGARRIDPALNENHIRIVALLLRKEVDTEHRRSCDKLTVRELVSEELVSAGNFERSCLQKILILLNKSIPQEGLNRQLTWPVVPNGLNEPSDQLKASPLRIQYYTSSREVNTLPASVWDFIYNSTISQIQREQIKQREKWARGGANGSQPREYWRWAHLPANNDVIRPLSVMDDATFETYWKGVRSFITESYHQIRGQALHTSFRKPSFTPLLGSRGSIFSLVIPYFDAENLECFLQNQGCSSESCKKSFANKETSAKLYNKSNNSLASFHAPCTLDQSYYLSLDNSSDRDKDQVVIKHVQRQIDIERRQGLGQPATMTTGSLKRLLMVNQMWIWKIDARTLITAFPDRRHEVQQPNLSVQIFKGLESHPPLNMGLMISRLLKYTTEFVDAPTNAGLNENLFHIFEQSIAYRAQEDANCYSNFYKLQDELITLSKMTAPQNRTKAHQQKVLDTESKICDITSEMQHLCEIKDVKDELRMIQRVLDDQWDVIDQYHAAQEDLKSVASRERSNSAEARLLADEEDELEYTKTCLGIRISKVKSLVEDATTVENSVITSTFIPLRNVSAFIQKISDGNYSLQLNHLLDLKQKQGNLVIVRDTRSLASEAEQRAKDSAWQSKLLFIFTIITVIFTPISFTSTFLAVPTLEFPRANGEDVAWRWWQVFVASVVVELLTFLVIAPWVDWNRFDHPWKKRDSQREVPAVQQPVVERMEV